MSSKRRFALVAITALLVPFLHAGSPAQADASCASPDHPGGDWPVYGHDQSNTRMQPLEDEITPSTAPFLSPEWTFSIEEAGGEGNFQSVPVVADGCVYVGTNAGWIFSLNADTGEVVWATELESSDLFAGLSGGVFALAVHDGRVFANVSEVGRPFTVALDQGTGDVLWETVVSEDPSAYTNSSVQIIDDMVFIGISGPEDGPEDRRHPGGFALLDPETGEIIKRTWVVSEEEDARGLKGASMWGTPVYDPETGYFYNGTGQPANKDREHSLSNAIVKVDADRQRDTFGEITDSYHGNYDEREDIDFGASPTFFTDSEGNKLVGAMQKSGVYHVAFADTMEQAWWARLSSPTALGNSGTAAFDGESIFVGANPRTEQGTNFYSLSVEPRPDQVYSLDADDGTVNWSLPVGNLVEYHPVTVAGGVVYVVNTEGVLIGIDASNGLPVLARPMQVDTGDACVNVAAGAAVARNTVYAHCDVGVNGGGWLVAYR